MLNKVQIIGRLGKDVEMRYTTGGAGVANVSIATSEKWTDKNGEKKERTEWVNLVAWKRTAEIMQQFTHKGSLIYVEGRLQTRSWDDRDGNKRYTTEVVVNNMLMLESKKDGNKPPVQDDSMAPPGTQKIPAQQQEADNLGADMGDGMLGPGPTSGESDPSDDLPF